MASISLGSSQASVGLDIGTDHIRVAQVKAAGSTFILTGYATVGVPMGAVVEGEIVDVEAVAASIREMVRTSGLHPSNCAIGVSNQKVVVRLIDLPYMERAELQGAIQYQAQDYIPIPVEDAILDFQIIGDYMTPNDEHMMEVLLVAADPDRELAGLRLDHLAHRALLLADPRPRKPEDIHEGDLMVPVGWPFQVDPQPRVCPAGRLGHHARRDQ